MSKCRCDENERIIYMMLNAAPLLAGQDERLRWRMLDLAESLAGLVSVQRFFHGCRPLFPYPGHWDFATRYFHLIQDLGGDTPGIKEMIKGAEAHNAYERLQRHIESLYELQKLEKTY